MEDKDFDLLTKYCATPQFQKGTGPLQDGTAMAVWLDGKGPVTLLRENGKSVIQFKAPLKPDLSIFAQEKSLTILLAQETTDIGEVGVQILKLMMSQNPEEKISLKLHIGILDFIFHGYLKIIPLGGPTLMKYLAEQGFGSLSKIKDALSALRSSK